MQRNITMRAKLVGTIRRVMEDAGFLDIQTPILFKPTPEGARDFVVPSRLQKGRFFALPQSPQILKQLLVIGGFDRYYQIAICFRDEDLRADRVQEITQLDVEMAFPDQEFLFALMELMVATVWRECVGVELETPFPRLPHDEAQARFGSDKPDLRFGLEIEDATELTRGSGFGVFANAPVVRYLTVPQAFSRSELGALEDLAKEWGAKGLAYLVFDEAGEVRSPIAKFLSETELEAFRAAPGSSVLFGAGEAATVARVLGALRLHLGRTLGLVDETAWRPLWVTEFPMFERDEEEDRWTAVHHPFTRPAVGSEDLVATDPGAARALAYDMVVNGIEIGGGSFRIHEPGLQARVFETLKLTEGEQRVKFGFLLDALAMGAPPHGGIAYGIERMLMALLGEPNLRDVIAFPKNQAGVDPMSGAPSEVGEEQLRELGITLRAQS
jgi:aspartyl-tRNA synthetase